MTKTNGCKFVSRVYGFVIVHDYVYDALYNHWYNIASHNVVYIVVPRETTEKPTRFTYFTNFFARRAFVDYHLRQLDRAQKVPGV